MNTGNMLQEIKFLTVQTALLLKLTAFTLVILALTCCGKKEEASTDTIEDIQKRTGIPVRVAEARMQPISEIRRYSGDVTGIHQKNIAAAIPEYIKKMHVSVGSGVKKDQLLVELDSKGNTPTFRQAEAAYEIARKSYERLKTMFDQGGIAHQQLDEVEAQYKAAKANFDAVSKTTQILAPFSGVVIDVNAKEGGIASMDQNQPLLIIADLSSVLFTMSISSHEIHLFRRGMPAVISLGGDTVSGTVTKVPLAANRDTRSFSVECTFPNKNQLLKPGMYVEATVITRQDTAVCVPLESVKFEQDRAYVYRVEDDQAVMTEVRTGIISDDLAAVTSGLGVSDRVVVDGMARLGAKTRINIID